MSIRSTAMAKQRLDVLLVARGLCASREQARNAVLAGDVLVDGRAAVKPSLLLGGVETVELRTPARYVSRGGLKLEHALATFKLDVSGLVCADLGASTGGFSDCLLQHGAARVYAIDVGHGQIDYRLRNDPRVVLMERVNARNLPRLPEPIDAITADLSFISLTKVLPAAERSLRRGGRLVVLVKPQFEARRGEVGKGGVVREPLIHAAVLGRLARWLTAEGYRILGLTASPVLGAAGNREFLMHLRAPDGAS